MQIISTVSALRKVLSQYRQENKSIGFAPTMGALHIGHIELMRRSIAGNDITVCSIFVNPTQFNQKSDLQKYPRTLKSDCKLLKDAGVDIVFAPSEDEIYPKDLDTNIAIDFKGLDQEMEGEFRPGHFAGVAQVVHRLLDIVKPDRLYMGQKDFQQFTIIRYMISYFDLQTELKVVPTVRDKNGLALSSRNVRLTPTNLQNAPEIYRTLRAVHHKKYQMDIESLQKYAIKRLSKVPDFRPEYFTIADAYTLKSIKSIDDTDFVVACVALWAGDVRLIDNMILKKPRTLKM